MSTTQPWSPAEDQKLIELRARRVTAAKIAEQLGRTKQAVQAHCLKLGLKKTNRKITEAEDRTITALYLNHHTVSDIARQLDRTYASVRMRVFQLGLVRESRKTRLAERYGMEVLANGQNPASILAEIREREEKQKEAIKAERQEKINSLLDEMQRGLDAGCDRAFMFTAALVAGATLQAIGDRVGLTRERVRQVIEKRADEAETQA